MFGDEDDEEDRKPPLLRRLGVPLLVLGLCAVVAVLGLKLLRGVGPGVKPQLEQHITQVMLPPPPPPPPPKPPPPPPKQAEEKPREQVPTPKRAEIPKAAPKIPKAPAPPGNPLTAEAGNGPSAYGLGVGNGEGGDCIGNCGGGGGGGGDMDAYLSSLWQSQIRAALARDPRLQRAKFRVLVDLAVDGRGHVTRASLGSFSGDPDVEAAIEAVLRGMAPPGAYPSQADAKILKVSITGRVR